MGSSYIYFYRCNIAPTLKEFLLFFEQTNLKGFFPLLKMCRVKFPKADRNIPKVQHQT